jgi:hypothetical protein
MKGPLKPPSILDKDKSPMTDQLLAFIENQNIVLQQQAEQIQLLKDEIARLKINRPDPKSSPAV